MFLLMLRWETSQEVGTKGSPDCVKITALEATELAGTDEGKHNAWGFPRGGPSRTRGLCAPCRHPRSRWQLLARPQPRTGQSLAALWLSVPGNSARPGSLSFPPPVELAGLGRGPRCGCQGLAQRVWASLGSRRVTLLTITATGTAGPKEGPGGCGASGALRGGPVG